MTRDIFGFSLPYCAALSQHGWIKLAGFSTRQLERYLFTLEKVSIPYHAILNHTVRYRTKPYCAQLLI